MRIHWCGLTFVGDEGEATYSIEQDGLQGVLDGAGTRANTAPRPLADGDFSAPGFSTSVSGSISGLLQASSPYMYERAVMALKAIPRRSTSPLVVQSAGGVRRIYARRSGAVAVKPLVYGQTARYMVEWFAPDPFWYGETNTFSGSVVQVYHRGDDDAYPIIEVSGPRGPYTIVGPNGERFDITQTLGASDKHSVDMSNARVSLNGVLQVGVVGAAGTWSVPAGQPVTVSVSNGPMTVFVTDTFAG